MLLAFIAATAPRLNALEEAHQAAHDALRAIGDLTRLAGSAPAVDDALRLHALIEEVDAAANTAVFTALARAQERCGK